MNMVLTGKSTFENDQIKNIMHGKKLGQNLLTSWATSGC